MIVCHPLFRGSSDFTGHSNMMAPSAIPHPLLMMKDPKSQSSFNRRNKSSSSSTRSGDSHRQQQHNQDAASNLMSGKWLQGRMRLILISFLFAFVPVLMHFRKRSQNQDTATWHSKKEHQRQSVLLDSGDNSDDSSSTTSSSSSSSSVNESSDEPAVQETYQQILASEVEVKDLLLSLPSACLSHSLA